MDLPDDDGPELFKVIDWSNMNDSFFNTVFPSIEGHDKNIDKYLKDEQSEYHCNLVNDRIKFHDPNTDDPDCRVKCCYTLLISATI